MQEVIENNIETEEDQHDMGSTWHSYLQSILSGLIFRDFGKRYISFSELSLELTTPYIQPNLKESFIVKPDISIYPIEQKPLRYRDQLSIAKMPLCAIEILSPRQAFSELLDKVDCYFANGIQSCWIIMPQTEVIFVFKQSREHQEIYSFKDILKDDILKIEFPVSELF